MTVTLQRAVREDCPKIHGIQVKAFAQLLVKYQDHGSNPAAESLEQVRQRFDQPFTDYYLIRLGDRQIGMVRVCDFTETCRISPIAILPEFQGNGYAQQALKLLEGLYPGAKRWTLDTILQEEKLCYLYEKLGYRQNGERQHVKDGMDLVYYEKEVNPYAGTGFSR